MHFNETAVNSTLLSDEATCSSCVATNCFEGDAAESGVQAI